MVTDLPKLTVPWLEERKVLAALGEIYDHREKALGPLMVIGFEGHQIPSFGGSMAPSDWWRSACVKVLSILGANAMLGLLRHVAEKNPGSSTFREALEALGAPPITPNYSAPVTQIQISIGGETADGSALNKIAQIQALATSLGLKMEFELSARGSIDVRFSFASPEEARRFVEAAREQHPDVHAALTGVDHHDYWMDPLYAEGPDGGRFRLDNLRASTRVKDVAQGVTGMYQDDFWPRGKAPVKAVIDRVDGAGSTQRLNPTQTLHQAGVRPHDTLRVHPEAQAGAVDPLLTYEALRQVKDQIRDFARSHPGFGVQVNDSELPFEYVFSFEAPSFGIGDPPTFLDAHEVFLRMGPDFPMEAPIAFWQTPIFHPNIDAETGGVCLGVLRESYRPALHFGEVCQMLIDMAAYRNYVVHEGFNPEAAQWAISPEGQRRIVERGGRSIEELYGEEIDRPITFSVRRVD